VRRSRPVAAGLSLSALPWRWDLEVRRREVSEASDCKRPDGMTKKSLTRQQAKRSARLMPGGGRAYHCPDCRWWHLTSKPKRRAE